MGKSGSLTIGTLESIWREVQRKHPDCPDVMIVTGTGHAGRSLKWGHCAVEAWQHNGTSIHEILISGERLAGKPEEVLSTLIHEAAHAIAHARGVQDTTPSNHRYHNKRFAAIAEELGLDVEKWPGMGYAVTTCPEETFERYKAAQKLEGLPGRKGKATRTRKGTGQGRNAVKMVCECGRSIRAFEATIEEGPIVCGVCEGEFV